MECPDRECPSSRFRGGLVGGVCRVSKRGGGWSGGSGTKSGVRDGERDGAWRLFGLQIGWRDELTVRVEMCRSVCVFLLLLSRNR